MRYVYKVTAVDVFNRAINDTYYSRDVADAAAKMMRDNLYNNVQVDESVELTSKEDELMLAKIMHDCYLHGFEAGFKLREVKGNEQK